MVDPTFLCRQHLLGEHKELHMLVGTIRKGTSIKGYLDKDLLEVHNIEVRHRVLVEEMTRRGYNHMSPLVFSAEDVLVVHGRYGFTGQVSQVKSLTDLRNRCERCGSV
jgi:heme oxygenase